ncbi:MAG: hypothetical protein ACI4VL_00915, partial [Bacilli bacterium]
LCIFILHFLYILILSLTYEKENPNKIIYGYGITLIKCVDELANKYGTCIFDRIKNKQELQQAKEKLEKQEAIALWDEA